MGSSGSLLSPEKPLPPLKAAAVAFLLVLVIGVFYGCVLLAVVWTIFIISFYLLGLLGTYLFATGILMPALRSYEALLLGTCRSLRLGAGSNHEGLLLAREDAPRLYEMVEDVARAVGVIAPDTIRLALGPEASVFLHGYRTGRGRCTLTIGYWELLILTEAEVEAIVAHEMAHARLVRRGFRNWVSRSVARVAQVYNAAVGLHTHARESGGAFHTAAAFAFVFDLILATASSLLGAYRRQDEFAADALAVHIAGADAWRNSLVHDVVAARKGRSLDWRDHLLQIERGGSFSDWLRGQITPADDAERDRILASLMEDDVRSRSRSHPTLEDRLAVLPEGIVQPCGAESALTLLADPDGIAERFIKDVESKARELQRKDTEQVRKRFEKHMKAAGSRRQLSTAESVGAAAAIGGAFGVIAGLVLWASDPVIAVRIAIAGIAATVGGIFVYRRSGRVSETPLPAPDYARWEATSKARDERRADIQEWLGPLEEELKQSLPVKTKRSRDRADYWADMAYRALQVCDYKRALAASQFCLEADKRRLEALLVHGIAAAYFSRHEAANRSLDIAFATYNRSESLSWALGWAFLLLDNIEVAEAYLLDAVQRDASSPTKLAVLGVSQMKRGKHHEATETLSQAVAADSDDARLRILLMKCLLNSARAQQALKELQDFEDRFGRSDEFDAMLVAAHINIVLDRDREADSRTQALLSAHPGGRAYVGLANALSESGDAERARRYYELAVESGFYPQALIALAYYHFRRSDHSKALEYLAQSLDLTRTPGDDAAPSSLALFPAILRGYTAMTGPPERCTAWQCEIDMTETPTDLRNLSLIVCAPRREDAARHARWLYCRMIPSAEPEASDIKCMKAPRDEQPTEPVRQGVYGFKYTKKQDISSAGRR